ncbi:MAG: hypothetical protein UZ03_NOB001000141 [Nitrospira sp. OLB3]|nr:MAG: hypothetical protein UZ03_NOB001000141 [Nitrospira sp. OLB3]
MGVALSAAGAGRDPGQVQGRLAGLREGEVKGYTSAGMGTIEGTEDEERGRRWGIQFECKGGERDHKATDQDQSEPQRRHP